MNTALTVAGEGDQTQDQTQDQDSQTHSFKYLFTTLEVGPDAIEMRYLGKTDTIARNQLASVTVKQIAKPALGMKGQWRCVFIGADGTKLKFDTNQQADADFLATVQPAVVDVTPTAVVTEVSEQPALPSPTPASLPTPAAPAIAPATPARATQTVVKEYGSPKELERGIAAMTKDGWILVGAPTSYQPNAGIGRVAMLGLGAAVIKPKPKFVATFQK